MRGVVIGILGTALVQGVLLAIGLWIAGIKAAPLLGLVTFFLSPVPIGPAARVDAGRTLADQPGADRLGHLRFAVGSASSFRRSTTCMKPIIISRGSDLPFVLVLLGVFGGAVAFGFIGVFLGPVLIAVGYALLKEWATGRAGRKCARAGATMPTARAAS